MILSSSSRADGPWNTKQRWYLDSKNIAKQGWNAKLRMVENRICTFNMGLLKSYLQVPKQEESSPSRTCLLSVQCVFPLPRNKDVTWSLAKRKGGLKWGLINIYAYLYLYLYIHIYIYKQSPTITNPFYKADLCREGGSRNALRVDFSKTSKVKLQGAAGKWHIPCERKLIIKSALVGDMLDSSMAEEMFISVIKNNYRNIKSYMYMYTRYWHNMMCTACIALHTMNNIIDIVS